MMKSTTKQSHWLVSLLSLVFLLAGLTACDTDSAKGYSFSPESTNFEAIGGTQILKIDKGDYKYCGVDYIGLYGKDDERGHQWLFIEEINETTYKLTASSNVFKNDRTAKLKFWFTNDEINKPSDKEDGELKYGAKTVNYDYAYYIVYQKEYEGETASFPFDTEKIESASVTSCVTWGKFYSESMDREYEDDEGGGFNFLNDGKKHSFTYETEASSNVVHVKLSGEANDRKAFLVFDLVYFSNPNEGVSKITNFEYSLETPSQNKRYYAKITDIPVTRIDDTTVYAEGKVADGVKFTDFDIESPNFDVLEPYCDSPNNRVSLYITFGSK